MFIGRVVKHLTRHPNAREVLHFVQGDIKPSNILVTQHDDVAVPKVIDFGIAKATQGRLTDNTVYTAFAQFIGTPAYMSPEQAEFNALDVDTRSDIYSLGVLLYELLTGDTPFDPKALASSGLDELRRIIREVEPPRPSTRVRTRHVAEASRLSSVSPAQAGRPRHDEIAGDLDCIVMKALEKNRTRRYESASAFAADVQRFLAHEPIFARPPSAAYTLQKLFRRHRVAFATAAAISAALVIGAVVSTWQAIRATRAEHEQSRLHVSADSARAAESTLRQQAQVQALTDRRRAYAADMNLAQQALADDKLGRALELLNRQRPKPGETDLRAWEWRYLWQFCQSEAKAVLGRTERPVMALTFSTNGEWFLTSERQHSRMALALPVRFWVWNART